MFEGEQPGLLKGDRPSGRIEGSHKGPRHPLQTVGLSSLPLFVLGSPQKGCSQWPCSLRHRGKDGNRGG